MRCEDVVRVCALVEAVFGAAADLEAAAAEVPALCAVFFFATQWLCEYFAEACATAAPCGVATRAERRRQIQYPVFQDPVFQWYFRPIVLKFLPRGLVLQYLCLSVISDDVPFFLPLSFDLCAGENVSRRVAGAVRSRLLTALQRAISTYPEPNRHSPEVLSSLRKEPASPASALTRVDKCNKSINISLRGVPPPPTASICTNPESGQM